MCVCGQRKQLDDIDSMREREREREIEREQERKKRGQFIFAPDIWESVVVDVVRGYKRTHTRTPMR